MGLRTIQRLELGVAATQLSGFLRVCRVLGLLERLETFLPMAGPGPMAQLQARGRMRQRVRARKTALTKPSAWKWGEPLSLHEFNSGVGPLVLSPFPKVAT